MEKLYREDDIKNATSFCLKCRSIPTYGLYAGINGHKVKMKMTPINVSYV